MMLAFLMRNTTGAVPPQQVVKNITYSDKKLAPFSFHQMCLSININIIRCIKYVRFLLGT